MDGHGCTVTKFTADPFEKKKSMVKSRIKIRGFYMLLPPTREPFFSHIIFPGIHALSICIMQETSWCHHGFQQGT